MTLSASTAFAQDSIFKVFLNYYKMNFDRQKYNLYDVSYISLTNFPFEMK